MKPYPAHPYAELFPMMKPPALAKLIASIDKNGQREKITTIKVDGVVMTLDGRNRELACIALKKKPRYEPYKGKDPLEYVMDKNAIPRHLTPGELAEAVAKALELAKASGVKAPTQTAAADAAGVSRSTVQRAVKKTRKPKEPEIPGWTAEEVKKDTTLLDDFTAIAAVYGNEDTKAIRTGSVGLLRADVATLAKLPKDKMLEIRDLIFENHWKPKDCLKFLGEMLDTGSTVLDIMNFTLATKGKFYEADINGYHISCKLTRAAKR